MDSEELVNELRRESAHSCITSNRPLFAEAADEIERLRLMVLDLQNKLTEYKAAVSMKQERPRGEPPFVSAEDPLAESKEMLRLLKRKVAILWEAVQPVWAEGSAVDDPMDTLKENDDGV